MNELNTVESDEIAYKKNDALPSIRQEKRSLLAGLSIKITSNLQE